MHPGVKIRQEGHYHETVLSKKAPSFNQSMVTRCKPVCAGVRTAT